MRKQLIAKKRLTYSLVIIIFMSIFFIGFQSTKSKVEFILNGQQQIVTTHAQTVEQLLQKQHITIAPHDVISPAMNTKIEDGITVQLQQARQIILNVDDNPVQVWTIAETVADVLREAQIVIDDRDYVSEAMNKSVKDLHEVRVKKAFEVTLIDGNKQTSIWTIAKNLEQFINEQHIKLNGLDYLKTEQKHEITPGEKITVVRVKKILKVEEDGLPFVTDTVTDVSILKGQEKIVTEGKEGTMKRTYEIVKENDEVVTETLIEEAIVKEPVTEVIAIGTKTIAKTVAVKLSKAQNVENIKEFYVEATAYTPKCDGCIGITSTGLDVRISDGTKVIAVDPEVIPLGTKVWVEDYGYAIAADTGSAIKGKKIDVLIHSEQAAKNWGRKKVRIKIL